MQAGVHSRGEEHESGRCSAHPCPAHGTHQASRECAKCDHAAMCVVGVRCDVQATPAR